jgi:hypothetical protein
VFSVFDNDNVPRHLVPRHLRGCGGERENVKTRKAEVIQVNETVKEPPGGIDPHGKRRGNRIRHAIS